MKQQQVVLFVCVLFSHVFASNLYIYQNSQLQSGWGDWSWSASINWASTQELYQSQPSAQVQITSGWGALNVEHDSLDFNSFSSLQFEIWGGSTLMISFVDSSNTQQQTYSLSTSQRNLNEWTSIQIPIKLTSGSFNQIWIQDYTGNDQTFYLANIYLVESTSGGSGGTAYNTTAWWNGLNIPWDNFGYDIGTSSGFNSGWFQTFFNDCQENNINSARFWIHCDGRGSPLFDQSGMVSGLSSTFLSDLTELVQMAEKADVVILLTLWSFDMCNQEVSNGLHSDLISNQTKTQSYIDNALNAMVSLISNYDNVVWEVINEPEWCIQQTPPSTLTSVPLNEMQRFVAMIASAIHQQSNYKQKVTVGSASLKWNSNVSPAVGNWWNDSSLQSAYSSSSGYLDFYQVHYYDWMYEWGYNPAQYNVTYWQLDKPTLVGELPATGGSHYTPQEFMDLSYANGFIGTAFWVYFFN